MMRKLRLAVVLLPLVAVWAFPQGAELPGFAVQGGYQVGVGDVLGVVSFRHEEITGSFPVEGDGSITYPLIGRLAVTGRTTAEIAQVLERLLEEDYYVDVQIQVEVQEYRSQPVTVLGEVARPGTYYLQGPTSLTQMLAESGGIKTTAGPVVELRRSRAAGGDAPQEVETFAFEEIRSGEAGSDVMLRVGDVISVSAKRLYFIHGEVARPGQYEIARDLTLMQAISQAGGLGKFASHAVEVHRESGNEKEILEFDISRIRKGKMEDPEVQAGDVIIVSRRFF